MNELTAIIAQLAVLWIMVLGVAVMVGRGSRFARASTRAAGRALTWAPRRIGGAWSREIVFMLVGASITLWVLANSGLLPW